MEHKKKSAQGRFITKYSGGYSRRFWKRINSLKGKKREDAYALGVMLQNEEQLLLKLLNAKFM